MTDVISCFRRDGPKAPGDVEKDVRVGRGVREYLDYKGDSASKKKHRPTILL